MSESFKEWGFKILSGDKSNQDMLVCFTLDQHHWLRLHFS